MPSMPRTMSLWCGAGGPALCERERDTPRAEARSATATRTSIHPGSRFIFFGVLSAEARIILLRTVSDAGSIANGAGEASLLPLKYFFPGCQVALARYNLQELIRDYCGLDHGP